MNKITQNPQWKVGTTAGTITNRNTGNVGIGTADPGALFDVSSATGGPAKGIRLIQAANNATVGQSYIPIDFTVPTTGLIGQFFATANNYSSASVNLPANSVGLWAEAATGSLVLGAGGASGDMRFNVGGYATTEERMRITSTGNVGINNDAPTYKLQVTGSTPASVATTPGTAATDTFAVSLGVGGASTIATTGVGGIGADITINTGGGGVANSADTASTGGRGGNYGFTGGTGGASAAAGTNIGGVGGGFTFIGGIGGASTLGTSNTGGAGGNIVFKGGVGGAGATAAGAGGLIQFQATNNDAAVASKMIIDGTGVGIGDSGTMVDMLDINAITGGTMTLRRRDASIAAGDSIGIINWYAKDNDTTTNMNPARIEVSALTTIGAGIDKNPGVMDFYVARNAVGASSGLDEVMSFEGGTTGPEIGFYGVAPVLQPSAYTQTYATAAKTVPAATQGAITDSTGAFGFLVAADRTAVVTAVNAAGADILALKKVINALIDDLQALGLVL